MALECEITELEDEQYRVTAWLEDLQGQEEEVTEFTVEPLESQEQAELVCDLLTTKAALELGQPLADLRLHSQAGPPTFQLSPQAAELIGSTDFEGLGEELQACAELLQDDDWQHDASVSCSAAGMLLLAASHLGNACTAQLLLLLQPGAAAAKGGPSGATPLHEAAEGGHMAIMKAILAAMPGAVHLKSTASCPPLLHAASTAQSAAIRLLLELAPAAAVHASSTTGGLSLHMAAMAGSQGAEPGQVEESLRLLLEAAPETALAVDFEGQTALFWAAAIGCEVAVPLLLEAAPAAASIADSKGQMPVHVAAEVGTAGMLRALLDALPASIAATSFGGKQPIHHAAARGNTAAVGVLLAARPDIITAADHDGWTAAHFAAQRSGNLPVMQLLIAAAPAGSCQSAQDEFGWRPAHVATCHNCPAVLRCLFESAPGAAQALATTQGGSVALHVAAEYGSVAAAEVLLEVAPEACLLHDSAGQTPLSVAAWHGQEGMVDLLLAAAPQAARMGDESDAALPIHHAAEQGHAAVVAQLLAADPQAAELVNMDGLTPLEAALWGCDDDNKREAVARVLLPAGPAGVALASLIGAGQTGRRLLPYFVAARLPMTDEHWSLLPRPCPGLGHLLPAVLAMGTEQAHQLVRHLPAADAERLRLAALCLARAQRRTRIHVPPSITGLILSLSVA